MRIRNRQKPLPLLPVAHSDPNLINRSPVMVQLNGATPKPSCTHGSATAPSRLLDRPQPFDPPIGNPINGSDASTGEAARQHKKQEFLVEDGRREEEGRGQKGNDTRKGSFSCSSQQTPAETFPSSNPPKEDGGWCEGEKAFPLKKRRGRMENAMEDNNNNDNDNDNYLDKKSLKMKMKTKIKAKMNKKCSRQDEEGEEEEDEVEDEAKREMKPEANVGKKRARGGALMEGSRCSRVNGRGWRCLQQTLVGYSLCEHHLGKGRLRSMTSVRNKSIGTTTTTTTTTGATKNNNNNMVQLESSSSVKQRTKGNDAENNDEKKPLMVTKKRMKLGMVKARSISSLLGQTNNTEIVAVAVDHDHDNDNDNK